MKGRAFQIDEEKSGLICDMLWRSWKRALTVTAQSCTAQIFTRTKGRVFGVPATALYLHDVAQWSPCIDDVAATLRDSLDAAHIKTGGAGPRCRYSSLPSSNLSIGRVLVFKLFKAGSGHTGTGQRATGTGKDPPGPGPLHYLFAVLNRLSLFALARARHLSCSDGGLSESGLGVTRPRLVSTHNAEEKGAKRRPAIV